MSKCVWIGKKGDKSWCWHEKKKSQIVSKCDNIVEKKKVGVRKMGHRLFGIIGNFE